MHISHEARFWLGVAKGEKCWLWTRAANNKGYGVSYHDGKVRLAHRIAWMLTFGPISEGLSVLHHCDTPLCVRPTHLFLGTQLDNMGDCVRKGRLPYAHKAKLRIADVKAIRARHAKGETLRALALEYGMSLMPIHAVVQRKTWKHVP